MTPVIQKMRRVPFPHKDKVTAKINELLEHDIIERVEGPTKSVSPVTVIPFEAIRGHSLTLYVLMIRY